MSKTAKFVEEVKGWRGNAKVFELSEPLDGHKNVIVSAVIAPFSGPETYIFGAVKKSEKDGDGNEWQCADWGELEGSYRGGLSHAEALENAGYEVVL